MEKITGNRVQGAGGSVGVKFRNCAGGLLKVFTGCSAEWNFDLKILGFWGGSFWLQTHETDGDVEGSTKVPSTGPGCRL